MLSFEDYVAVDAVGWAERIRRREVTAREVVEAAIARAEQVGPTINAFATRLFEQARAEAAAKPSGPLAGVPWVTKDYLQTMPGVPVANGSRAYEGVMGAEDSELITRYRRAGLVILGTSTCPELALSATTESTLYGVTRNPWSLDRTSGGSSGGASALVAAGVVPAAHATDGGGSIRGPASCCGLFGLKPSRGRVPVAPGRTEGWLGCSASHAVTRSVRDSAALLDATHGPELGSRYVAPPPRGGFLEAAGREPGRLRIAYHHQTHPDVTPDRACIDAVEDAARLCASLGHEVEPIAPDLDYRSLSAAFGVLVISAIAATVRSRAAALGKPIDDLLEQTTESSPPWAKASRRSTSWPPTIPSWPRR
jgi:amidase